MSETRDVAKYDGDVLERLANPVDSFQPLDVYVGGISDEAPRVDAIASISAGYRDEPREPGKLGLPKASRDGRIYLHDKTGRAPGLKAALETTDYKRLTIAFPLDDPRAFIQQRFMAYSATSLLAYGDQEQVTAIKDGRHTAYRAGTDDYARVVATCKVTVSVYFCLAQWTNQGPEVIFPDGLGFYRLRFTSRNSLRSIIAQLKTVARFTRGKLAGIPFELSLDYREVSDPSGAKRTVPVWVLVTQPPEGLQLSSRTFHALMSASLHQGELLMLPAPSQETIETAWHELPEPDLDTAETGSRFVRASTSEVIDRHTGEVLPARQEPGPEVLQPTEREVDQIARGGLCDYDRAMRRWHALAHGSIYERDDMRAFFMRSYTNGATSSLGVFLHDATERDAAALFAALETAITDSQGHEQEPEPSEPEPRLDPAPNEQLPLVPPPVPADTLVAELEQASFVVAHCKYRLGQQECGTEIAPKAIYVVKGHDVTGEVLIRVALQRAGEARCTVHLPPPSKRGV